MADLQAFKKKPAGLALALVGVSTRTLNWFYSIAGGRLSFFTQQFCFIMQSNTESTPVHSK